MAGAALVVEFRFLPRGVQAADGFAPNAFVRITPDNTVTIVAKHLEMGQGAHTGLATVLADELDADWAQVRVEAAPSDPTRYNNLLWGPVQGTGGSSAIANSWAQLRKAGATARAMLVSAAAQKWGVRRGSLTVDKGVVSHAASGRRATFGELATAAAAAGACPPRCPSRTRRTGSSSASRPRASTPAQDRRHGPLHDGRLPPRHAHRGDPAPAPLRRDGEVGRQGGRPQGSGGYRRGRGARRGWRCSGRASGRPARAARRCAWSGTRARPSGAAPTSSWPSTGPSRRSRASRPGATAIPTAAFAAAAEDLRGGLRVPLPRPRAHGAPRLRGEALGRPVRGLGGLADPDHRPGNGRARPGPSSGEGRAAHAPGRRQLRPPGHPVADVAGEAASVVKAIGGRAPVKLVWTREDDIRGGRYRPLFVHRLRAGLDASGRIVAWEHRIVGQSFLKGTPFAGFIKDGIDADLDRRGLRPCPTPSPTSTASCTRPRSGCPPSGGARSGTPTPPSRPRPSSTRWPTPRGAIPSSCAASS